jgi:hypothetical protein
VNLTGPLLTNWYPGLNGRLDAYIQNRNNALRTTSSLNQTISLNLNAPLPHDWTGRLSVFVQNNRNRLGRSGDILTRQFTLGADHAFNIGGWRGYITPGITVRINRKGNNDSEDIRPALAMRMNQNAHSLNMNYGSQLQDRRTSLGGVDVNTHSFNMDYRYRYKQHTVGLEANIRGRDPQPGETTEAYRISAFWTMEFDRPAVSLAARGVQSFTGAAAATEGVQSATLELAQLGPGAPASFVTQQLNLAKVNAGTEQAGLTVYESSVFPEVFRRQRLVLEYTADVLRRSAVIIDFDDVGNRDSNAQVYERIRQALIRELGNPTRTFEEGEFSDRLIDDVNDESFFRITEWTTNQGTVRFGIPRRLDGAVRMEIQHAIGFGSPRNTLWSIEEIR